MNLSQQYIAIRKHTEDLCKPLLTEDYIVQPVDFVSPPKWHLGHVTWFFETFVLLPNLKDYKIFDPQYGFLFNSYYQTVGPRILRQDRGTLSRPAVEDIYKYRKHVDDAMLEYLKTEPPKGVCDILVVGFNHEQQHQELLLTDIKYILGNNPLFPVYQKDFKLPTEVPKQNGFISLSGGQYQIGYEGDGFCYDNEMGRHTVYLNDFKIVQNLVTNGEYLEFIDAGGYKDFNFWLDDGWTWINVEGVTQPLYWHFIDGKWYEFTLKGLQPLDLNAPVNHVSFYEAVAFASWKGLRLPSEAEWEVAGNQLDWGRRWEWTESAYLPYPGFVKANGALGEYNGKFMVNQKVLKGASDATPEGHSRITYRNFFQPYMRWQYMGIRLAQ